MSEQRTIFGGNRPDLPPWFRVGVSCIPGKPVTAFFIIEDAPGSGVGQQLNLTREQVAVILNAIDEAESLRPLAPRPSG